jgi:TolA-binding protein
MGAIGGAAAALIVSAIFFLLLPRSGEGPEPDGVEASQLRREIEDHVVRLDGVFRQILFSSGSHPERDLELARYELGSLDLFSESSRLTRNLRTASGDLGARGPDPLEARSVLLAAAQTVKELRLALDESGAPSVRLEAIRNQIRRHRTLESIAILIHQLRGPEAAAPRLAELRGADDFGDFVDARRLYLSGNYREAFQRFRAFLERHPRSEYREDSIYWMGNCAERLGEPEMAQEIYTAIADAPWFEKRTW